ncbi:hypothetical protein ACFHPT_06825 [Enterococcus faecium]|nr:hypothetical protein [Enterococcus faecium]MCL4623802.1 hypothetical protein [Enterococcus faecium]
MAEMHDHLLRSICERTGLSEEEVNQKLMEISEAMNKGVDSAMNQLDDFLAQHMKDAPASDAADSVE